MTDELKAKSSAYSRSETVSETPQPAKKTGYLSFFNPFRVVKSTSREVVGSSKRIGNIFSITIDAFRNAFQSRDIIYSNVQKDVDEETLAKLKNAARMSIIWISLGFGIFIYGLTGPVVGAISGFLILVTTIQIFCIRHWHYAQAIGIRTSFVNWPSKAVQTIARVWEGK